ncbi:NUDIX domain-containing protein [Photobacterium atrarenae]|uniref:NUDIX domain-containing protein n=1 Tax=Photobacterium atrarenae TaxID=865757 RepID=A0ABY5GJJ7_9GAMM|nr:NUDIX domain-containing protein [Photobacterium atrarenae]UTV29088.1 NUDIX domain-containing protein [Photobacterium atrarenae]
MTPRISVRAVFYNQGHILLCKHHDNKGIWYITPGGGIEHGETLEDAFHRELKEELGAEARMGDVLCIRDFIAARSPVPFSPPDFHQVEIFVEAHMLQLNNAASQPDDYQVGYEWLPLDRLTQVRFYPQELAKEFQRKDFSSIYQGHKL